MTKTKSVYECQNCGTQFPKWLGRCTDCGGWNTLVESVVSKSSDPMGSVSISDAKPIALNDLDIIEANAIPTGVKEFDHVLGGGLVPGSVTLISGEPGIGKSTLVMQIVGAMAEAGISSLYSSAEESSAQIRARANRLEVNSDLVNVLATNKLEDILHHTKDLESKVLIVDSIHTVTCDDISSSAGTVSQVRECAHRLTEFAKSTTTSVIVVGQVTKEGTLAGPRVLEHVVDSVLSFEGDDHALVRTLRASKHRFGTTDELGLFDMTEKGLVALEDPSALMTTSGIDRPSGLAIAAAVDGSRPFLVEVQALVVPTTAPMPRRVVQGIDSARVSSLIAVLEKRCGVKLSQCDVYVSLVGGIKVKDAGLDMAICMAIASADKDKTLSANIVFAGEVGLSGEVRPSIHAGRRIREAARRGHKEIFINLAKSDINQTSDVGIQLNECSYLNQVIDRVFAD